MTVNLCYGLDVPHPRGLHPDLCQGSAAWAEPRRLGRWLGRECDRYWT